MLFEREKDYEVLNKEDRIRQQINKEVNKLLNISEERKRVVADFLFWIISPNGLQSFPSQTTKTRDLVFSEPKLELAVKFVGSRLALRSEAFADVFRGTIKSSQRLSGEKAIRRALTLFRKGTNLFEIVSQTSPSLIEGFYLIRRLKRNSQAKIKAEQDSFYQLNELDLTIAFDWLRSLPKKQIMENHNLKRNRFDDISNKLIDLGLIKRRRLALTQWEKKELDEKVANLSNRGNSRSKIAGLLKATEGIIHSSLRRLQKEGKIRRKFDRFAEKDWQELAEKVILLRTKRRTKRLTWAKIGQQLKISQYRCSEVSKRLRTKPSQNN